MKCSLCLTIWLAVLSKRTSGQCGLTAGTKIVGGESVPDLRFPWYVALVPPGSGITVACGGSLITSRHVLTAAHCFPQTTGLQPEQLYRAVFLLVDRCTQTAPESSAIAKVHIHPFFDPSTLIADVAVAVLERSVPYTTICLPPKNSIVTGPAIIIGFGSTLVKSQYPCTLQEARVNIMSRRQCERSGLSPEYSHLPGTLCAGLLKGGVDSCDGDSGGPLQTVSKGGIYTIQGIVSFGEGCARKNLPGVYTRVSAYIDFIDRVIHSEMSPYPVEIKEPVSTRLVADEKWDLVKTRVPVVVAVPIMLVVVVLLVARLLADRYSLCFSPSDTTTTTSTEHPSPH